MPAASSAPGSHLPPKKKKHKWHPPKGVGSAIGGAGSTATKTGGGKKAAKKSKKQQREAEAAAREAVKLARKAREKADVATGKVMDRYGSNSYLSEPSKGNIKGYRPTAKDALDATIGKQVEEDIKKYAPKSVGTTIPTTDISKYVHKLFDVDNKYVNESPMIGGPLSRLAKIGEAISRGAKGERLSSGTAKGLEEGVKGATRAPMTPAPKPRPPKRPAPEGGKFPKGQKQAAEEMQQAIGRSKGRFAYRAKHPKEWEVSSKAGLAAKIRRNANRIAWAGGASGAAASVGGGLTYQSGKALVEDPAETLKTTGKALPAMPGAAIGTAVAVARGDVDAIVKEWMDYANLVGQASQPGGSEIIKKEVGLIPEASLLLAGAAAGRYALGRRPDLGDHASILDRRLQRLADEGNESAATKLASKQTRRANRIGRKTVTQESQRSQDVGGALASHDLKTGGLGRRVRGGRKVIGRVQTTTSRSGKPIFKKIRLQDAVGTLLEFPVALSRNDGLPQVRQLIDSMERNRGATDTPHPTKISDLDVLRAIEQNPAILENSSLRKALEARAESAVDVSRTRNAMSGGDPEQPLEADLRAANLPMARHMDVRTPEERVPAALEGVTSVEAKPFQNAEAAIRKEASILNREANRLQSQGKKAEADAIRARVATLRGEVNKLRRADAMTKLANRLESGQPVPKKYRDLDPDELKAAADKFRADAEQLVREQMGDRNKRLQDFAGEMQTRLDAEGYRTPVHVAKGDSREAPSAATGGEGFAGKDQTPKEQMSLGLLAIKGLGEAGAKPFLRGVVETRINQAQTLFTRAIVENPQLVKQGPDGKPLLVTTNEFNDMVQSGEIGPGYTTISLQELGRAYQKQTFDEAAGLIDSPTAAAIREARGLDGRKQFIIQKGAKKEFLAQGKELGLGFKGLRLIGGAQSLALLATSPAWFLWQLAASPMLLVARHPDVLVRFPVIAKQMVQHYRSADKQTARMFEAMTGNGPANVFENLSGIPGISSDAKVVGKIADAQALARSTWAGRLLHGAAGNLKRGGPLMLANRKYEGFIRQLDALLEIDKMIRAERHPQFHRLHRATAHLDEVTGRHIAQLKGKTQAEIERFYLTNGTARRELGRALDDGLGNWNALSSIEKRAATAFIFYPFLRFSLRWTFYAFPKNNPGKAIILANLAQINAIELEKLNGDKELNFFSDYGKVHVPGSNEVLPLGRIAPGSNALIEAGLGGREGVAGVAAGFQPLIGSMASALANQDSFTGRALPESEQNSGILDPEYWKTVGEDMVQLPAATRPLTDPSSPYSQLLRAIRGQSTNDWKFTMKPQGPIDADREMEAQRVGRLMDVAFSPLKNADGETVKWETLTTMSPSEEKLRLIRKYNEQVKAKRELIQQFEKYGMESPLKPSKYMKFPVAGSTKRDKNQETKQPPRAVYIDPKKKKRWYDAGRQYSGSSDSGGAIDFGGGSSDALDFSNSGSEALDFSGG